MDNKKLTALVLLDLSKAFDSVDHSILLKKLSNIGVSSEALNWFESYITDRKQFVRIGSSVSEVLPITHGVPQGQQYIVTAIVLHLQGVSIKTESSHEV
jgi:hypothetical protein